MADAYPLNWPEGWPRTPADQRAYGRFGKREQAPGRAYSQLKDLTVAASTGRVLSELQRMGAAEVIVSTNLALRRDGLPYSNQRAPQDQGVAVYWTDRKGAVRCIAIDRYIKVADNLAAIAATLDAMRAIERHGGAEILDRAFTGFTALPAPGGSNVEHWSVALGVPPTATRAQIDTAWRTLRGQLHPDRAGGDEDAFKRAHAAYARACSEASP